jgi:hypothetical protein
MMKVSAFWPFSTQVMMVTFEPTARSSSGLVWADAAGLASAIAAITNAAAV